MAKNEKKSSLTEGQITITLDGLDRELIPSVEAITKLSRVYGGLMPLIDRLRQMDIDAYVMVARYGLQVSDKEAKDLPEKIFEAGMTAVGGRLVDYVFLLMRGGREDAGETEGDTEGNA